MLKIRGHHLLCIPRYYHGGYNKQFACRHRKVCKMIRKNPDLTIRIVEACDDLCAKCPYDVHSICKKSTKENNKSVLLLDEKVFKKLNIRKNSKHIAKEIFNRSIKNIKSVRRLCEDCSYYKSCLKSGINEFFVKDLNKNNRIENRQIK